MKPFRTAVVAALTSIVMVGAAHATDLYSVVDSTPAMADDGFDWQGFYAGVYKGTEICVVSPFACGPQFVFGGLAGVNFLVGDDMVASVEGRLGVYYNVDSIQPFPGAYEAFGGGRLGVLTGDDTLIFGSAGLGVYWGFWGTSALYGSVGAGIEHAVSDDLSLRGDAQARICTCPGGLWQANLTAAAVWHLD